ncbi:hypothetical protein PFICI_06318 [Pestalotiopsis fici W106-1]|uniref:Uncharacterized protein n=1 Tax=Pestalotiopsis fici (strain W106-1 / CGMCC3.15140) TaxID=1229662 RepID=W3X818_PESFW|nr:uncharacterized protein PFICI_06318 [Pestalotiopsis fici W106-1]ETS81316.1 hypothetical protein PFICI_06318 [Pestalotiopsis fici W106-1]
MVPSLKMNQDYRLLTSGEDTEDNLRVSVDTNDLHPRLPTQRYTLIRSMKLVTMVLVLSAGFVAGYWMRSYGSMESSSPYAKLEFTKHDILWWNTEYSSNNASIPELNKLWDTQIPWESGIIALENEEARRLGLPDSQPFPWDSSKKSIYIVNAHHILHCVRNLYISIQQYRTNTPQTIDHPHILHCLDSLRVETMCNADDTLRYVPLNSMNGFRPGDGQDRTCREWSKLQQFVERHDPCYRYVMPGSHEISNLERFKFCPTNSEYLPKIRKYFGYTEEWVPEAREGRRELDW